jgi:hypothetical protein
MDDPSDKFGRTVFWSSKWDRYSSVFKSMASNPRLRGTVFFINPPDGGKLQAAEWCLSKDEWYDVSLDNPKMTTDYLRAMSVLGTAVHSSNFTDGMILKTMQPTVKLALGKKTM